ncbi:MAG: hypothetical protein JWR63_1420 [Conexibacter sp.]|nr:hypothetical protein [Conexibacter sp.]
MRRLVLRIAAGVALLLLVVGFRTGSDGPYEVAAEFDTAKGLVPGNAVKIAGTPVGKITDVELTPRFDARVSFEVERRFAPFRADASCRILSQGLISEYFVQCDPGRASRAPLPQRGGRPTVALARTSAPVGLQDVFNIFSRPSTVDRVRLLVNELGIGLAGRGADLNGILRRSNPALGQTEHMLRTLAAQRRELGAAATQTEVVLAKLAQGRRGVREFVAQASAAATTTATHASGLAAGVRDLPPMLQRLAPAAQALSRVARRTTPVLRDLRGAAPQLNRLNTELPALAAAGTPALQDLGAAADRGRKAIPATRPVTRELRAFARREGVMTQLDAFLTNLRDAGGVESILRLFYAISGAGSAYDSVSHFLSLFISVSARCLADHKAPGCDHRYSAPGAGVIPFNDPDSRPVVDGVQVAAPAAARSRPGVLPDERLSSRELRPLLEYLLK